MDMKEEMMSDAVDDVMDEGLEDEEEESDKILKQVLDEIGVDLSQQVRPPFFVLPLTFGPHTITYSSQMHQPASQYRLPSQSRDRRLRLVRAVHREIMGEERQTRTLFKHVSMPCEEDKISSCVMLEL